MVSLFIRATCSTVLQAPGPGTVALGGQQRSQLGQRFGVLRLQVQRLAIETLSLRHAAFYFAEQAQPVKHLCNRLMLLQIALAGSLRLGTFAFVGQAGNPVEQRRNLAIASDSNRLDDGRKRCGRSCDRSWRRRSGRCIGAGRGATGRLPEPGSSRSRSCRFDWRMPEGK